METKINVDSPAADEPQSVGLELSGRATPPCPHFGPCGGCQLQHLAYPAQLAGKAARLRTLLAATRLTLPELQLHPSPPLAYRNRIRLTLAEVDGELRAGYLTANVLEQPPTGNQQPTLLPITQCPIAAPILWRTAEALLARINESPAPWLRNPQFKLDQLELFTTADESALQLTLALRTAAKNLPSKLAAEFGALCDSLRTHISALTGAGIAILPPASPYRSRRTESARTGPTWGAPGIIYQIAPLDPRTTPLSFRSEAEESASLPVKLEPHAYWVPRTAFFQVNRFLLPELLALATANRSGDLALDLYAGVGLFSHALARSFNRITAVEIAEPAFTALASTKLSNLRAVKATTLDFLRTAVIDRDRPSLIVLDPPRTGAGAEICALLGRIAAPALVYVSCSPERLPTDLATLAASGYAIAELHLFDLFPQTTHIETVAILTR
jgi:23S rRNA (uracil1939-C5)-methyltransferase